MKFGLDVPVSEGFADVRLLANLASEAEAAGWDGVFLQDVLNSGGPVVDPWIALGAVAAATERVRFGIFLTPLPRRRPWQVARQASTIDHISNGRLIFGGALGYAEVDFTPFGEEWDTGTRAAMLDEGLEVINGLWTGDPFSYQGDHYQLDHVTIRPRPVQSPRIPVWLAAGWPRRAPLRRAGRWDGVYLMTVHQETGEFLTPDDVADVNDFLREESGDPIDIALNVESGGNDADRIAISELAEAGATWWIELAPDTGGPDTYLERIRQGPPAV